MKKKILETDYDFTLASEVKISVMSCQRVPIGTSPHFSVCGCPKTVNYYSNFGDMVVKFTT